MRGAILILLLLLASASASASASVRAMGGFFDPPRVEIRAGDDVTWTNADSMPHTITSTWDSGKTFDKVLRGGESFTWTFSDAGSFAIHCRPHAYPKEGGGMEGMSMSVNVRALETGAGIAAPLRQVAAPWALFALVGIGAAAFARRAR